MKKLTYIILAVLFVGLLSVTFVATGFARAERVSICHQPGPDQKTLKVPPATVPAHIKHGDYLGECWVIGWANTQWPPSLTHTCSETDRTNDIYGQVWIDGITNQPGPTEGLHAQVGFGPEGSLPDSNWVWEDAQFNVDAGNNDEFGASFLLTCSTPGPGTYDYLYRYGPHNNCDGWLYADLNGPIQCGALPPNPGKLTVNSPG